MGICRDAPLVVDGVAGLIQAPEPELRMMRHELTDYEWTAIKPFLPNKPRGVPRSGRNADKRTFTHGWTPKALALR